MPIYLNTLEAAAYLRLSKSTLAKARVSGRGPPYLKVGRRVLYRHGDLDAWAQATLRSSTSQIHGSALSISVRI